MLGRDQRPKSRGPALDVSQWLRTLGLERYEAAFQANDVDADVLPHLTAEDLKDLGIISVGHRRQLLEAIVALGVKNRPADDAGRLSPGPTTDPTGIRGPSETTAERRPVTLMFCDLIGSTALSSRLDPEDLRHVMRGYLECVTTTVQRFDGFIASYVGDGVLIYFGWPEARETDAERAVRAGLAVAEAVSAAPISAESLQVRIGIATGLVVIGEPIGSGDSRQQTAVGETLNVAARLQGVAGPGQVVIDVATRRQIGGLFECQNLGELELKGLPAAVSAWRVLSENSTLGQFEALRLGNTPLVGRDEELELLLRRWVLAKAGHGRVVLISAEPGVGKSRLVETLVERIGGEPHNRLRYFCSPHHQDSALYPVIAQMERAAGFAYQDGPPAKFEKLQALLAATSPTMGDVALIADMHALPTADLASSLDVTPQRRKEKTFEALLSVVEVLAQQQPLLIVFDDIHWIDPSTRELLDRLIERVADWPLLLVGMFRPEFQPPWTGQPHVTMLTLTRLDRHQTAIMVANVAGEVELPRETVAEITDRTDGVPLFVEELTKALLESGAPAATAMSAIPFPGLSVPATLHASLMARLDRLGPAAKDVAQTGAAIGRAFGHRLMVSVTDLPELQLQEALDRLTRAGLLLVRGIPPQASYMFNHALVQDAAYSTLLRSRRQRLHGRIAIALENGFPELSSGQPEVLAFHHQRAQNLNQSLKYWVMAGDICEQRGASSESVTHYRSAHKLLDLPDAPDAIRLHEPEINIKLGNALMQVEGYDSEESRRAFGRARSAAARLELPEEYARAGIGVAPLLFGQCRYREFIDIGEGIAREVLEQLRPQTRVHLWTMLGVGNYCIGEFERSLEYEVRAAKLDDDVRCTHENPIAGGDPAVVCRGYAGMSATALGLVQQSAAWSAEAWNIANARGHAFSVAWAGLIRMRSLISLGHNAEAVDFANLSIGICERHGFNARLGNLLVFRGAARFGIGEPEEGLADMRHGIAQWRRVSGTFHLAHYMTEFAQCLLQHGETREAELMLQEAKEMIGKTDEQSHCSEIHRLLGQLYEAADETEKASECYVEALDWSRARRAKLFELRASTSLARLWGNQGRRTAARDLLFPVYNWFTDIAEAPDLKDAKLLLDEIA